jgi:hypothetical protein
MASDSQAAVARVFCEILERQAFVFGEAVEKDELPAPEGACVLGQVGFTGALKGSLVLAAPHSMLSVLSANALGLEPEDEQTLKDGDGAFKEALNVACGHILTELAGQYPVFNLATPVVEPLSPEGWDVLLSDSDSGAFIVEDLPVVLKLSIQR